MKTTNEDNNALYAQMGLATLIPGMQRMMELMQRELDSMRAQLAALQAPKPRKVTTPGTVSRPRKVSTGARGWPADPLERSNEMKRRQRVAAAKRATHSSDPNHPNHAAWLKKVSNAAKSRWAKMSVRARKERLAAMQAGKAKSRKAAKTAKAKEHVPVVKLEEAAA